jgi:hypothetical protein
VTPTAAGWQPERMNWTEHDGVHRLGTKHGAVAITEYTDPAGHAGWSIAYPWGESTLSTSGTLDDAKQAAGAALEHRG